MVPSEGDEERPRIIANKIRSAAVAYKYIWSIFHLLAPFYPFNSMVLLLTFTLNITEKRSSYYNFSDSVVAVSN